MKLYDHLYTWQGWGGRLQLGSGRCRLRIFDLAPKKDAALILMQTSIVIVEDLPPEKSQSITVRSCAGHIATQVCKDFNLDPKRMLFIEYYPEHSYGIDKNKIIPESFVSVAFNWHEDKAISPRWQELTPDLCILIKALMRPV